MRVGEKECVKVSEWSRDVWQVSAGLIGGAGQ